MELTGDELANGERLPATLSDIKIDKLLAAVYSNPQGGSHRDTIDHMVRQGTVAEMLQQTPDYAVFRVGPNGWMNRPSHWLAGHADEHGMFVHNLPFGQVDYSSEDMKFILRWINRIDDGFRRVQGDLLVRKVDPNGWEAESLDARIKEEGMIYENGEVRVGNGHRVGGAVVSQSMDRAEGDRVVTRTGGRGRKRTNIDHMEHNAVVVESHGDEYQEVALQRRGNEQRDGGD